MYKKFIIHLKFWVRIILIILIGLVIIGLATYFVFKPTYSVTLNGEFIGYTDNKQDLQDRINTYMRSGDSKNIAFVEIDTLPEYKMVLLKKDIQTNTDEIFSTVIASGTKYYKYYAILEDNEEKYYVSTFEEAEQVVNELKEKDSNNKDNITYSLKYSEENKEYSTKDDVVASLYIEKPKVVAPAFSGSFNTMATVDYDYVKIGVDLIQPVSGLLTSRFGERSGRRSSVHTGLDIATSTGTPIQACADGVVTFSGYKGSYGNMIVIDHGGGVQTYYAHIMYGGLLVSEGDVVSQGDIIAKVGSTGNSTGSHCHLEVRVDGVALDPSNYIFE